MEIFEIYRICGNMEKWTNLWNLEKLRWKVWVISKNESRVSCSSLEVKDFVISYTARHSIKFDFDVCVHKHGCQPASKIVCVCARTHMCISGVLYVFMLVHMYVYLQYRRILNRKLSSKIPTSYHCLHIITFNEHQKKLYICGKLLKFTLLMTDSAKKIEMRILQKTIRYIVHHLR